MKCWFLFLTNWWFYLRSLHQEYTENVKYHYPGYEWNWGSQSLWRDSVSYMWRKFYVWWTEWVGIMIEKLILDTHKLISYNFYISNICLISRRQNMNINCSSYFILIHEKLFLCHLPLWSCLIHLDWPSQHEMKAKSLQTDMVLN